MRPLLPLLLLAGCAHVPMTSQAWPRSPEGRAKCLLVLLPGAGDKGRAFEEQGFVELVRQSGLSVDVIAADATFEYYSRKAMFERIRLDVVEPAHAKGYERTWVAGISMGGMGALLFTRKNLGLVDGVLAMAPYLGDADLHREISQAGGLAKWNPPTGELHNYQRDLWRWFKALADGSRKSPSLYLAYGEADGMSQAHALLEKALPAERVYKTPGGHEWEPWRTLFRRFLAESDFARQCKATGQGS